jgi:hypothetical protein
MRHIGQIVELFESKPTLPLSCPQEEEPAKLADNINRALHDARGADNATGASAWLRMADRIAAGQVMPRQPRQ